MVREPAKGGKNTRLPLCKELANTLRCKGDAAPAGANLACLRNSFCARTDNKHPATRAAFGRRRGVDTLVYRRENF